MSFGCACRLIKSVAGAMRKGSVISPWIKKLVSAGLAWLFGAIATIAGRYGRGHRSGDRSNNGGRRGFGHRRRRALREAEEQIGDFVQRPPL